MGFRRWFLSHFEKPRGLFGWFMARMMNTRNRFLYDLVFDVMHLTHDRTVLEVGFGNGVFLNDVSEKVKRACGIDISSTMVKLGRKNAPYADIKEGSVTKIPYPDGTFDVVFTVNTLYFWKDVDKAMRELHRVTKKGGEVFVAFHPKDSMEDLSQYNFTLYETADVIDFFTAAGFTEVHSSLSQKSIGGICVSGKK